MRFQINKGSFGTAALALVAALLVAAPAAADTVYLRIAPEGLEDLGSGFVYEGWVIVAGTPVSTGTWSVSADGAPSRDMFAVEVDDSDAVEAFVLTIEPVPDHDPAPSAVKMLGGAFANGTATATAAHPAALGDDLTGASGSYILNAPSGGDLADYFNGIWWLDPNAGPGPTLDIPALNDGWVYEGWVVGPEGPVSTGRFMMATGADSDGAGFHSGPYAFPAFPGQDFVHPATDLTDGYAAVVSIEPHPDTSPGPFAFKPLVDGTIEDVGAGVPQDMVNQASGFPTVVATLLDDAAMSETAYLWLDLHGLENVGPSFVYEGWLIVDGQPVSTGIFEIDDGVPSTKYFPTTVSSLDEVSAFVLTIEPVPDSDPAPSAVHILGGDFAHGAARLSTDSPHAIGTDFSTATGSYILNAPSGGGMADYFNGIWWLDPAAGPGPTLDLPELPDGWVYEGWVVNGGDGPISTGRFTMPSGADSDGAGPDSGDADFPPFPGQDFVDPARDLTDGYMAVISVEPDPDTGAGPFALKPLVDVAIDDVGAGVLQPMHSNPAMLPGGVARLMRPADIVAGGNTLGVGNIRWLTDMDIANLGDRPADVFLELLRSNVANQPDSAVRLSLEPWSSVRVVDVFGDLFGYEGTGAVRVLASHDDVVIASRTFYDAPDGSFGQGIPAMDQGALVRFGGAGRLVELSDSGNDDEGFRTNLGMLSAVNVPIEVHVELYRSDGSLLRAIDVTLQPHEQRQLNRVFTEATDVGFAVVSTSTPGGAFWSYASVVSNPTDDPTFVAAQ